MDKSKKIIIYNYLVVWILCVCGYLFIQINRFDLYLESLTDTVKVGGLLVPRFFRDSIESLGTLLFSIPIAALLSYSRKKAFSRQLVYATLFVLIIIVLYS